MNNHTDAQYAEHLVKAVCASLGTSLNNYMPITRDSAIYRANQWLKDYRAAVLAEQPS